MNRFEKAMAVLMLMVAVVLAARCTKSDDLDNGGGGNGGGVDTQTYTITTLANPTVGGTVTGNGTYNEGSSVTLRANANTNYIFDHWQDGDTTNPRTITVTSNATYAAYFTYNGGSVNPQTYTITTLASPTNGGNVSGGGTFTEGQSCTVTATPNTNYTFTNLTENGTVVSTNASYNFTVTGNRNLVAHFSYVPPTYTVSVSANPTNGGAVTGGGNYNEGMSVTLRANANTNYIFECWQDGDTANPRTITVTANATYTAYFTYNAGNANGHAYVDLGLPSGTLWATCNVGATYPEGYGDYFAWGETQPKYYYDWSTYKYCKDSPYTLTKYCNNSNNGYNGFTDDLTTLQLSDDAARANWGGDWRMPTKEEWQELRNNTTVTWTKQNGIYGRKFIASNGNSLFLPAAGTRLCANLIDAGFEYSTGNYYDYYCNYWSSSLDTSYPNWAYFYHFGSGSCPGGYADSTRRSGHSVRAVLPASKN